MKQKRRLGVVLLALSLNTASDLRAAAPAGALGNAFSLDCRGYTGAGIAEVFFRINGKTAQIKILRKKFPANNGAWVNVTNLQISDFEIRGNVPINSAMNPEFSIEARQVKNGYIFISLKINTLPAYEIENIFNFEDSDCTHRLSSTGN